MQDKEQKYIDCDADLVEEETIVDTPYGTVKADPGDYIFTEYVTGNKYVITGDELERQVEKQKISRKTVKLNGISNQL